MLFYVYPQTVLRHSSVAFFINESEFLVCVFFALLHSSLIKMISSSNYVVFVTRLFKILSDQFS